MTTFRARPTADRVAASRAVMLVLACGTFVYALAVVAVGLVALATQLAAGVIRPTMTWRSMTFSDEGDGRHHVVISGAGGAVLTSVSGASAGTTALYIAATLLGLVTQAVLAVLAWRLLRRLRDGRPFERAAWREVALLAAVLLTCGIAAQLLNWLTQVAVLVDDGGSSTMTAGFRFEPLTITAALALALIAFAFRAGERLQLDSSGLV